MMNRKVIAYSLIAHINENNSLATNYEDFFVPLVKRALSKISAIGNSGGDDLQEVNEVVKDLYGIDMPNPVLLRICKLIEKEINGDGKERIKFYSDYTFIIKQYTFDDYEEFVQQKEKELSVLERVYLNFINSENLENEILPQSIYEFIEVNKLSLGKYINKNTPAKDSNSLVSARFIEFIKDTPDLYKQVQELYIGAIISTYLEFEPKDIKPKVELVLDTNFIVSLLDLNTVESTRTCQRLIDLGKSLGYFFTVLDITIQETNQLIESRINNYDSAFLSKLIDIEDIYNACHRRNLSKTDLERINANLEKTLQGYGININYNTEKLKKIALNSTQLESLKKIRNTQFAALHDATCFEYVKSKRTKVIYEFSKANCWFVNNSSSRNGKFHPNGQLPWQIKAEDLLNMLWLTSPGVRKSISVKELANIGISRMISNALNDSLPNSSIIRELDENIRKYSKENISDDDIVRISKSIAQRKIGKLDDLNELAKNDDKEFTKRLQDIADSQKESEVKTNKMFTEIIEELNAQAELLKKERKQYSKKKEQADETVTLNFDLSEQLRISRKENLVLKNNKINSDRELFRKKAIRQWQRELCPATIIYVSLIILTGLFTQFTIPGDTFKNYCLKTHFIYWPFIVINGAIISIFVGAYIQRYFANSTIDKFAEKIKYPANMELIEDYD